jgi:hypothetical protein
VSSQVEERAGRNRGGWHIRTILGRTLSPITKTDIVS